MVLRPDRGIPELRHDPPVSTSASWILHARQQEPEFEARIVILGFRTLN